MRIVATSDAAREGDWLASAHHAIVGLSLLVMAVLPIIRRSTVARGEGFTPKVIAVVGGYVIIPLAALPLTWRPDWLLTATTLGLMAGAAIEIWALMTLRRSFSVFPEARKLVTHGPYGRVRHPLYAVYIVSYVLVALPRLGVPAFGLAALGIVAQVMRSKREEQILRSAFSEYDEYGARVPAFMPRFRRPGVTEAPRRSDVATAAERSDEAQAA
jgi:protein-S-isoprenylcysteine O-methyltransferase Ste14